MDLPLSPCLEIGLQTIHRRSEPASGPWLPKIDDLVAHVELAERCGYDSLWVGDHIAFTTPILDPLLTLAQAAVASRRLKLGTGVYLLPLRHPVPVAKMVATLDHLCEGRLIFGVGVGGEFPKEFEASGVPHAERGARLAESVAVLRRLWSGESVSHRGRFFAFENVRMLPPPRQEGGLPIWFAGRSDSALARAGRLADGWISYVVTPEAYGAGLARIAAAAQAAGRRLTSFGTGHLLFVRLDDSRETALAIASAELSRRYAMDFTRAAQRYAALGRAEDVAERIRAFHAAGLRHLSIDLLGPYEDRPRQIERFAAEVVPLIADLRGAV